MKNHCYSKAVSIFLSIVLSLLAISVSMIIPNKSVYAAGQTVGVDLSTNNGSPNYKATGFLHALTANGAAPADNLVQVLKPKLFRGAGSTVSGGGWTGGGLSAYQARFNVYLNQYQRVTPWGAKYHFVLADLYGFSGNNTTSPYPGDNNNWSDWDNFIARVVSDVKVNGMIGYYEIWNEPDYTGFWTRSVAQYNEMWRRTVSYIRANDPNAKIVGPSYSRYNSLKLGGFLDTVKANGTVPNVLNWHFSDDPVADASDANSLLSAKGISGVSLTMNEYLWSNQQTSGYTAWYMARIQKSALSAAAHAIWNNCCEVGLLDDILNTSGQTKGQWWVYKRYAYITGNLVSVSNSANIDGVAGKDTASARMVLGNNGGYSGDVDVNITNLSSVANLIVGNQVSVTVERISDVNYLAAPVIVQSQNYTVSSNQITITLPWTTGSDSFAISLSMSTPGSGSNVALNKTVTGYSSQFDSTSWAATNINDGLVNSTYRGWASVGGATTGRNEWVKIDLGQTYTLDHFTLTAEDAIDNRNVKDYVLYGSNTGAFAGEEFVLAQGTLPSLQHLQQTTVNFTSASARYVKFKGTSTYDINAYIIVGELAVFGVPPTSGLNVALYKPVTGYSSQFDSTSWAATNINDGVVNSTYRGWASVGGATTGRNEWVKIDLGLTYTLDHFTLTAEDAIDNRNVKDYVLYGSNTGAFAGEEFVLAQGTLPSLLHMQQTTINFTSASARYIMFKGTSCYNSLGYIIAGELAVFGS